MGDLFRLGRIEQVRDPVAPIPAEVLGEVELLVLVAEVEVENPPLIYLHHRTSVHPNRYMSNEPTIQHSVA